MKKDSAYSWFVMVATVFSAAFVIVLPTYGSLSFLTYTWIHEFGLSAAQVGYISAGMSLFMYIPGPLYNAVIHLIGNWKAQILATFAIIIGAVSAAYSTEMWQLLLSYSLFHGMGAAMSQMTLITTIKQYFDKYKSAAFAVSYAGNSLGVLSSPIIMDFLVRTIHYKYTLLVLSGIVFVVGLAASLIYRGSGRIEMNELSKEVSVETGNGNNPTSELVATTSQPSPELRLEIEPEKTIREKIAHEAKSHLKLLNNIYFILSLVSNFFASVTQAILYTYIIEFAVDTGYATSSQAAVAQTVMGTASLIAAILLGILMRFNKQPIVFHMVAALLAGLSMTCFPVVKSLIGFYIVNFVSGFTESMLIANIMSHVMTFSEEGIDTRMAYMFIL